MEFLLVIVVLGLIAAIVAVICIAVSASGIKSSLDVMMVMFQKKILPELENLEKIREHLEDMASRVEPRAVSDVEKPEAAASHITQKWTAPSYESAVVQTTVEAAAAPQPPVVPVAVTEPVLHVLETEMPALEPLLKEAGTDVPAPPLMETAPETRQAVMEEAGMKHPLSVEPVVEMEEPAEPEIPNSDKPLPAASKPLSVFFQEQAEAFRAQSAIEKEADKPEKPEEPAKPSAISKAFEQLMANITPVVKSLWRQGSDFLMKEGHIWVVAGVLVLLLGISFFVRYSIAMGWFSPPLRLASSSLLGIIIFAFGFRLRQSRRGYGLLLQSCGLGILYLTTVAAVRLYTLLEPLPATGILTLLVALTAVMALWQNAQLLAHVSIIAAFAAPLLVSQSSGNYAGLFSFYCIINAGILAMSFFRPWRRLYLTGFILTFGIFTFWAVSSYRPEFFSTSMPFLTAFFAFYALMGLRVTTETMPGQGRESVSIRRRLMSTDLTLTILTPLVFLLLTAYIGWNEPYVLASCAFGLGVIYVAATRFLLKSHRDEAARIARLLLSQGLLYANLALPLTFLTFKPELFRPGWLLGLVWSMEGAFIYRLAARDGKAAGRMFGLLLLLISAALGLHTILTVNIVRPLISPAFLLTLLVAAGALAAADAGLTHRERLYDFEKSWPKVITGAAMVWLIGATALEVFAAGEPHDTRGFLAWLVIGLGLEALLLDLTRRLRPDLGWLAVDQKPDAAPITAWPAMTAIMAAAVLSFFYFETYLGPKYAQETYRMLPATELAAWLVFSLGALLHLIEPRVLLKKKNGSGDAANKAAPKPSFLGLAPRNLAVITIVLALGRIGIGLKFPGLSWNYFSLLLPAVAALGILCFLELTEKPQGRVWLGGLLSALCLWNFLSLLDLEGYSPYIPVLNPSDIIHAAVAVLPGLWLYLHLKGENKPPKIIHRVFYIMGLMLFIWLNVVLGRTVHHWLDEVYSFSWLVHNDTFQTMAAISWAVVGITAMITGHRAARRPQWLMGAILIGADVLKLFFVDLSQADTITRVVSFICVGVLLILVGYFAPLPPKAASPAKEKEQ
ncbi:hypothetical protein C4J81_00830 [Deltaproteobacteria bacterium Smac51]|nr:hypothetical protein C4J81_00830 [Deltaproteobacteria bacterium Smac51]